MRIIDGHFEVTGSRVLNGKRRPIGYRPLLTVDEVPHVSDGAIYKTAKVAGGTLYLYEADDWARFFLHDPHDERGYGGARFSGLLEDGTPFMVKGPWSSSCSTVNALGIAREPLATVAVRSDKDQFPRLYYGGIHLPVSTLRRFEALCAEDWELVVPSGQPVSNASHVATCSDEQRVAVFSPESDTNVPYFRPRRELEDCDTCAGYGSVRGEECRTCRGAMKDARGRECWSCFGRGFLWASCPTCNRGHFCCGGFKPYPRLHCGA